MPPFGKLKPTCWSWRTPLAWSARACRRRRSSAAGRGRGARLTISIRVLFVALSVLFVAGAISFSWAFTYAYAMDNVRELSGALLDEAKVNSRDTITAFLATARQESYRIAAEFDAGRLSEARWRQVLESLSLNVAAFPEVSSHLVRFASGNVFGVRPCRMDVGASSSCVNPEVFISNGTHRYAYTGSERGQPLACTGITKLLGGSEIYDKVAASATDSAWLGLSSVSAVAAIPALRALDRIRMQFGVAFRGGPTVFSTHLEPDLELPVGIPLSPQVVAPNPAASPSPAPIAGIAAVALGVGVLSDRLKADRLAREHAGLLVITDGSGVMIASSTAEATHLLDDKFQPIHAADSPHACTRALVSEASRRRISERETESGSFDAFACEGRTLYFVQALITAPDGIEWHLYMAVPEEALTSRLRRSILVISLANSLWLIFAVTMAALTAAAITRPIDRLHTSLTTVVETISAMTQEMADARQAKSSPSVAAAIPETEPSPIESIQAASGPRSRDVLPAAGLRELARFGPLLKDVQGRFAAFQQTLTRETQLQMEIKVRAEQTKRMLGTMSHEMRTPLNGILGMLELVLEEPLPGEAAAHLRAAVDCADHLFTLITDLLDFQRINAGAVQLRSVPVDVREVLSAVLRVTSTQSRAKGIPVRLTVDPHVPALLLCDPDRLRQILINLVGNALKYSEAGAVDVRVRVAAPKANAASALCVEVEDKGRGIPTDARAMLFSPFYRAHAETDAKLQDPGGTGLGLAICKDLVERLGGEIGCVSQVGEGHGSTFFVFLPLLPCTCPSAPSPDPRPQPLASPAALAPSDVSIDIAIQEAKRAATYLIADDDAVNRRVTEAGLRSGGHTVTVASDGEEAVRAFEAACGARPGLSPFDAILMDCLMPRMDGMEASRAIRAVEARLGLPRCPIVAYTSFGDPEDEAACLASGMDAVLTKPARKKDLLAKLDAVRGCSAAASLSSSCTPAPTLTRPPAPALDPATTLAAAAAAALELAAAEGPAARAASPRPSPSPSLASCSSSSPERRGEPAPQSSHRRPLDVLVVDDVEMNRRVLGGLLRREGHAVEMAGDGEEAVAAFASRARAGRPYALILMDVAMPKLDGLGASRAIRALELEAGVPAAKRTPIAACTATLDEDQTRQAGMDMHLLKPVTRGTLLVALERLVPSEAASEADPESHVQMKPLSLATDVE